MEGFSPENSRQSMGKELYASIDFSVLKHILILDYYQFAMRNFDR